MRPVPRQIAATKADGKLKDEDAEKPNEMGGWQALEEKSPIDDKKMVALSPNAGKLRTII
jgi:hypothetical protein